ncbi:helix-turn-helix domain-containing protein [Streptomyces fildesensis]|uniref:Helix-turn-helix domain-containing protein n=1 Tax=Streptomyces fildesensis TaxID=375757 RepID=A0ABW8C3B6_9ACTN
MSRPIDSPWSSLSHAMVPVMKVELPALGDEIIRTIRAEIPAYAVLPDLGTRQLEDPYGQRIRQAVENALGEFVDRIAPTHPGRPQGERLADNCRKLGRTQMREGRSLDTLHSAYRLGARVAWRRCVELGGRGGIPSPQMYTLAEALFAFIDELAGYTVEGYVDEQAQTAGERHRRRMLLLDMLTAATPPSHPAVADLATAAGWIVPTTVQAVALARGTRKPLPHALPHSDTLADLEGPEPFWLLPDPGPGSRHAIERALQGRQAAVGLVMPLVEAGASLRLARRLLVLSERGLCQRGMSQRGMSQRGPAHGSTVLHCSDHLASLLLTHDETVIRALALRRLTPLQQLTPKQRDRLSETLLAWLQCGGNAPEVARLISVHPQTVRYRVRQLESLFGPSLRDPDVQFELEIVLRAQELRTELPNGPNRRMGTAGRGHHSGRRS